MTTKKIKKHFAESVRKSFWGIVINIYVFSFLLCLIAMMTPNLAFLGVPFFILILLAPPLFFAFLAWASWRDL